MPIKVYKPTSAGRRDMTGYTFEEITKSKPERALTTSLRKKGGRNNTGRVTVRHRGGGHKRRYRIIDFKRNKFDSRAEVLAIEYDPNRSARIALVQYEDGEKRYIIAPLGLKVGDTTYRSDIARDIVLEVKLAGQPIRTGMKIPKGSRLDLVLGDGNGASDQEIPELVGQDLVAARFAIKGAGFTLGSIIYQGNITDSSSLKVISQFPMRTDSATTASIGTRINLTVTQAGADGN